MPLTAEQKQLILDSEMSALIFGKGEEFVLIRLDIDEPGQISGEEAAARDLVLCGVLGYCDGKPVARLSAHPSAMYTAFFAGLAFAHIVADRIRQAEAGDSVEWLKKLWQISDAAQA